MLSANTSDAAAPKRSLAVTMIWRVAPASASGGVPVNRPVAASNASQSGSGISFASVAIRARLSPASTSVNAVGGRAYSKIWPATAPWSASGAASCGGSFAPVTVTVRFALAVPVASGAPSVVVYANASVTVAPSPSAWTAGKPVSRL